MPRWFWHIPSRCNPISWVCFFASILATFSSSRHTGIPMDLLAGIGYACAGLLAVLAAVLLGMAYRLGLLYQLWHKVG